MKILKKIKSEIVLLNQLIWVFRTFHHILVMLWETNQLQSYIKI